MGYTHGSHGLSSDYMAAFNHSIHNCWYQAKHDSWPPGNGPVQSIKPACEDVYASMDPWDVDTDSRGYVCYGVYNADPDNALGYVGRCWQPGGAPVYTCTKTHPKTGNCSKWEWVGGTAGSWVSDACIEDALKAYCGQLEIPEVVDPTDQADVTGDFWNLPAVLVDSGVVGQVGEPLGAIQGNIDQTEAPTGLIQKYAQNLRIGTMVFNHDGSKSECNDHQDDLDDSITYACTDSDNRDGGKILSYVGQSDAHTDELVEKINDIKATSWTPIAEAMYSAIGYYGQKSDRQLIETGDDPDFKMDGDHPDPVQHVAVLSVQPE